MHTETVYKQVLDFNYPKPRLSFEKLEMKQFQDLSSPQQYKFAHKVQDKSSNNKERNTNFYQRNRVKADMGKRFNQREW